MERKIGEIFEYNGEWYQCLEEKTCTCFGCNFHNYYCEDISLQEVKGSCQSECRNDKTSVIFKKLEKVGKPYFNGQYGKVLQEYKYYIPPITPDLRIHIIKLGIVGIEIKQNKEDMKENENNKYDGKMDKECIPLCDALNSLPDVKTTESCCGHCKDRFMIFFKCKNPYSLAIIARVFDRRYIDTSQLWHIELLTNDSGSYEYFIHSETKYNSEEMMMRDVNQIIENIKYWSDDRFASHFKSCDDIEYSNPESIGKNLKPFDLEAAKEGKPICTRDGRKARIICFDSNGGRPIVALVTECDDEEEIPYKYHCDGSYNCQSIPSDNDLMMPSEKKEGWVNIYKNQIHDTLKSAEEGHKGITDYFKTIKIEWEE